MQGYLIDSDVPITAKNRYYAFPICPGFWDSILYGHSLGSIHSIDQVRRELLLGHKNDDLVQWVDQSVPESFFLSSDFGEIVIAFREVMDWVHQHPQYYDEAKSKFATGADGWLVAHGIVHQKFVVTNEQPSPESRNQIKLPDVCNAFSVDFNDTFAMLHKQDVQYHYSPNL